MQDIDQPISHVIYETAPLSVAPYDTTNNAARALDFAARMGADCPVWILGAPHEDGRTLRPRRHGVLALVQRTKDAITETCQRRAGMCDANLERYRLFQAKKDYLRHQVAGHLRSFVVGSHIEDTQGTKTQQEALFLALLDNPKVQTMNGLTRAELCQIYTTQGLRTCLQRLAEEEVQLDSCEAISRLNDHPKDPAARALLGDAALRVQLLEIAAQIDENNIFQVRSKTRGASPRHPLPPVGYIRQKAQRISQELLATL